MKNNKTFFSKLKRFFIKISEESWYNFLMPVTCLLVIFSLLSGLVYVLGSGFCYLVPSAPQDLTFKFTIGFPIAIIIVIIVILFFKILEYFKKTWRNL